MHRIQRAHPRVELYAVWTGPGEPIRLKLIRTLPAYRGRGLAEAALTDVLALADALHLPVQLTVEPIAGDAATDESRLALWYRRHGFSPVCCRPELMHRPAR